MQQRLNLPDMLSHNGKGWALMECESCQNQRFIFNARDGYVQCEVCDACKTCSADCGGRGFIFETSADGYRFAKDCPCTKMTKRAELMSRARLPSRYAQAEFGRIYVEDGESDIKTARSLSFRFTHEFEAGDPGLLFMDQLEPVRLF